MNISFINPEQMLYSQIQIQIHPSPFQWMLPLLCYVIQLLHHELREDQFASILQVGVLTLSGVPCPFSSRNSVIWNTVLETVQERASLIRKYFVKDLISPNHINEPCYMLYIWLPAVPHVTVIGQTTLVVPKEHSLRPVKMDFWNYTITRSWKSSCWSPNVEEDRLETRPELSLCSRLDYRIGCTWWASTLLSTPVSTYTVILTHIHTGRVWAPLIFTCYACSSPINSIPLPVNPKLISEYQAWWRRYDRGFTVVSWAETLSCELQLKYAIINYNIKIG